MAIRCRKEQPLGSQGREFLHFKHNMQSAYVSLPPFTGEG